MRALAGNAKRKIEPDQGFELRSVDECANFAGNSPFWWRRAAYDGRVASVKLGTSLRIPLSEVKRIIAEGTRPRVVKTTAWIDEQLGKAQGSAPIQTELRAELERLSWSAITAENPAQIGDEIARFRDGRVCAYYLLDQWDGKTCPSPSEAASHTHRRPINPPKCITNVPFVQSC